MATVRNVLESIESFAPARFAFGFDRIGLQVGDPNAPVERAVVSLDRSQSATTYAIESGAQMLVAHHPLIFEPITTVTSLSHVGQTILDLVRNGIAFAAAHTNWDSAQGGINDALADRLGLRDVAPFGSAAPVPMLKLVVFAPTENVTAVIEAAAGAGAGVIGNYSDCAFLAEGTGQFRGNEAASPAVGQRGRLEHVAETRVEMVLRASLRQGVERAVRESHLYEEPTFHFVQLCDAPEQSAGRIGRLAEPMTLATWSSCVDQQLETRSTVWGPADREIRTVALVGGAADGEWTQAQRAGADVYLTGEVRQHVAVEASESGIAIVAAGHYATEQPGCVELCNRLSLLLPEVKWTCFEPRPGIGGRPL